MSTIPFLQKQVAHWAETAQRAAAELQAEPGRRSLSFFAGAAEENLKEARLSLRLAEAEVLGELLELRFIGPKAEGSIPLDMFMKVMEPLSKAFKQAAQRLRSGVQAAKLDPLIAAQLNIKLAGIGHGSTRIYLTGNAMPDTTGESLLQNTLVQTFRLLNATNDDFYDAVDAIGGKAAHEFGEAMTELDRAGMALEMKWQAPSGPALWQGRPDEINRIRALIATVKEPERFEETISGVVSSMADTGRIELRTEDGKVQVRFPLSMTAEVQRLTLSKPASMKVLTAKYWDAVGKRYIFKRQMLEVV